MFGFQHFEGRVGSGSCERGDRIFRDVESTIRCYLNKID